MIILWRANCLHFTADLHLVVPTKLHLKQSSETKHEVTNVKTFEQIYVNNNILLLIRQTECEVSGGSSTEAQLPEPHLLK